MTLVLSTNRTGSIAAYVGALTIGLCGVGIANNAYRSLGMVHLVRTIADLSRTRYDINASELARRFNPMLDYSRLPQPIWVLILSRSGQDAVVLRQLWTDAMHHAGVEASLRTTCIEVVRAQPSLISPPPVAPREAAVRAGLSLTLGEAAALLGTTQLPAAFVADEMGRVRLLFLGEPGATVANLLRDAFSSYRGAEIVYGDATGREQKG